MKILALLGALIISISTWATDVVNINNASKQELETLKGIGPVIAERIIQYRERHGRFTTLDELDQVKGISEGWIARTKDQITFEE
jgi:competence protein ComEA